MENGGGIRTPTRQNVLHHQSGDTPMSDADELKSIVRQKYADIAEQSSSGPSASCCGPSSGCCDPMDYSIMADDYGATPGYVPEADLGLGCGIPTAYAGIRPGMTVLDLGSGAGADAFVAAHEVGPEGRVIGVDMTQAMIDKANANLEKTGRANVEFRLGEIEALPVEDDSIDVILSNCVLNLVPDKARAFAEMYRVLKPGGSFTVSDIVVEGALPEALKSVAELYAGCVSGAMQKSEYLRLIRQAGFDPVEVPKEKEIVIPDNLLQAVAAALPGHERDMRGARLLSVTVTARKVDHAPAARA
jgi:arsenite methyltransferase